MQTVIEQARRRAEQAELYWQKRRMVQVSYANYRLQQVTENDLSSVALRVIVQGKLGMSCGNFPDQPELLSDALASADYGDSAVFAFAGDAPVAAVDAYDDDAARLTSEDLIAQCEAIKQRVHVHRPDIALSVRSSVRTEQLVVQTTGGADRQFRRTMHVLGFGAPIKGAGTGVSKSLGAIGQAEISDTLLEEFLEWYGWTERTSTPSTGRLPVLLAPEASFLVALPLQAGLSGDAVEKKTSPLLGKLDERILSERLTIVDDPLRPDDPRSRPFDDEGVPCARRVLVDRGVLRSHLLDLRTGAALGRASTGNGLKRLLFGGGTETPPSPWAVNLTIEPGTRSYKDLLSEVDEGILLTGGMGFHSGNYPQGQFAVQAVGFHIIGGRVVGRLEKTMVSGNIYQDLLDVRAISAERRMTYGSMLSGALSPYILIDGLQVAGA